jgi:hypothetical protein
MSQTIAAFNACKHAIGQLLVRFDRELTADQKTALGKAWEFWNVIDRVGRARARKIIWECLGEKARDVLDQLDTYNKEHAA